MYRFLRNLRMHGRRLIDLKRLRIDGVLVGTCRETLPRFVRTALFKETYETAERKLVGELIEPTDRVLEIGAGIGLVSLLCAKICGPENVLSYEANRAVERVIGPAFLCRRSEGVAGIQIPIGNERHGLESCA